MVEPWEVVVEKMDVGVTREQVSYPEIELGLSGALRAQAALATKESLSYPRFLLSLSEIEVAERHERKIQRQRRASRLPWEKTLTALDRSRLPQSVDRQLAALLEGTFLDRAENVLAFGNPGSGKTHLV